MLDPSIHFRFAKTLRANGVWDRSHGVIRKGHDYGGEGFKIRRNGKAGGLDCMYGGWNSPGGDRAGTPGTIRSVWYHAGFVIDRENQQFRVFHNGQFSGSWAAMDPLTDIARSDGNGKFGLGKHGQTPSYKSLLGRLDDVHIYHRALNECDIAKLYNGGAGLPQDGVEP